MLESTQEENIKKQIILRKFKALFFQRANYQNFMYGMMILKKSIMSYGIL